MQDRYENRKLAGLNTIIVQDATDTKKLQVEKDLTFFGRETRPIHKTLATTTNPFIPGISGEEDKALAFLSSLNIPLKTADKWRALRDLTETEKKRLSSALADYLLNKGLHFNVTNLIGHIYTLTAEQPSTNLRDAREFAVLLNSTGRMDRPSLGIAVCMGDRKTALQEANQILEDYRKNINKYLNWVWEKPQRLRELQNIYALNGEDYISEKIIGTISGILITSLPNTQKPLIAFANVPNEGLAKISSRTTDIGVHNGINLGEVMRLAAEPLGGKGGGHNIAAGGQVPIDKTEEFLKAADETVGNQLRGEKVASNNPA
jgi:RecJ-like exonuclease